MTGDSAAAARIAAVPAGSRVPRGLLWGYGVGSVGTGIYSALPGVLLLIFLTDTLGVTPAVAAAVIVIPKLWSVVCDPLVGRASDRLRGPSGTRAPHLLMGALACALSFSALFAVPAGLAGVAAAVYVGTVFLLAVTAYSVFSVPYVSLPVEMSADADERATIISVRMGFVFIGALLGAALAPALVAWLGGGRLGYSRMSLVLGVAAGLCALTAWKAVSRLPRSTTVPPSPADLAPMPWYRMVRLPRFQALLLPYLCVAGAISTLTAALPYLVRYRLQREEAMLGLLFLVLVGGSIASLPLWLLLSRRLGKRSALYFAMLALALACVALGFAVTPVSVGLACAVAGVAFGGLQLLPFSLLSDVLRDQPAREGAYTGLWTAVEKTGLACGPLLVGALLQLGGFAAATDGQSAQPHSAIVAIVLAATLLPVAWLVLAAAFARWLRAANLPDVLGEAS